MGNILYALNLILDFLKNNLIGLLNIIVAFLLVRETKRMRELTTRPELVFYLKLINKYTVIGRLENVGNGTAYNISIDSNYNFKLFHENNFNDVFNNIKVLVPKQYFDVQIHNLNANNEINSLDKEAVINLTWYATKKISGKPFFYKMKLDKYYFKNTPREGSLSEIADSIRDLKKVR